jgi:hypothetical protein
MRTYSYLVTASFVVAAAVAVHTLSALASLSASHADVLLRLAEAERKLKVAHAMGAAAVAERTARAVTHAGDFQAQQRVDYLQRLIADQTQVANSHLACFGKVDPAVEARIGSLNGELNAARRDLFRQRLEVIKRFKPR